MRAMILAAGRGERMRPLTDNVPKPLLMVGGKPLIVWHIERLADAGVKEIVINHAHLGLQIESALGNGAMWGVTIQYSPEATALETAGGIANALPLLGSEPFLVVNGDVFTDIDFAHLIASNPMRTLAHLVLVENPPQHPEGDFFLKENRVTETGENRYTFSGIGVYHPAVFNGVPSRGAAKLAPILRELIPQHQVSGQLYCGMWHDIGTPERLIALNAQLQAKRAP